jgi:hypothetical protein
MLPSLHQRRISRAVSSEEASLELLLVRVRRAGSSRSRLDDARAEARSTRRFLEVTARRVPT